MKLKALILTGVFFSCSTFAASTTVTLNEALPTGTGGSIGEVSIAETPYGLLFTPNLKGLEAGIHGFHVHENASCEPAEQDGKPVPALAAGGHLDPKKTGKHLGPYNDQGHLGDLPGLVVNADGTSTYPILAPRIKSLSEVKNHALMVHVGGDNYADTPAKLGGGGARMACGVIK
ncbi:superoxide dismutase [Cu-Zn] SodC [Pectobacterium brasiliense]|uniref:Superoxide dismutase [Cu-Zn] n=3 Tax=Pectobacterium brasiliense TaxID=180957 RepID=A0A3S1AFV7_9GAMM|nr:MULTISPECIES: superoxide dismutase family protein [Pectobacterium]GKW00181.1 superoxide dismutase [Cu-Zn] [Pectobacterium carotovorum subsp. carotovorum]AFR03546.1 superoxide dismutase copper/zinc binding protein [Pectobacterium carotovorum subsp. carotovorum PCC21]APS30147.1 superoxide dismutase [Pectobacterium brasiliense]KHS66198.1 superoxide dismutase [Pectobacterium brasiliense]KHS81676.1 superoxide dismutase [Pectobacterium brasiliense]